ncbi:MAG TPA: pilus assembly protein TadG-related protein, partial [Limnobacter sp.]|nr:pilus assembly protein TadG-related protein [Limnobacter sp.]
MFEFHTSSKARRRQRGAYSVLTVVVLMMSLGALGVLAVGHTAWEKSRLQGVADLVALTAARQLADGPGFAEARALALENGVLPTDSLTIQCVINNAPTADCANAITSRVTLRRPVNALLPFLPDRQLDVLAEATVAPTVVGTVSSGLLALNTNQSALLNGLLTALGGGSVQLNVAQWGSLLGSNIRVDLLDLATELGVLGVNDLLSLNVSA